MILYSSIVYSRNNFVCFLFPSQVLRNLWKVSTSILFTFPLSEVVIFFIDRLLSMCDLMILCVQNSLGLHATPVLNTVLVDMRCASNLTKYVNCRTVIPKQLTVTYDHCKPWPSVSMWTLHERRILRTTARSPGRCVDRSAIHVRRIFTGPRASLIMWSPFRRSARICPMRMAPCRTCSGRHVACIAIRRVLLVGPHTFAMSKHFCCPQGRWLLWSCVVVVLRVHIVFQGDVHFACNTTEPP